MQGLQGLHFPWSPWLWPSLQATRRSVAWKEVSGQGCAGLKPRGESAFGIMFSSNHALSPYFITLGASFLHFLPLKPFHFCALARPMEKEKIKRKQEGGEKHKTGPAAHPSFLQTTPSRTHLSAALLPLQQVIYFLC